MFTYITLQKWQQKRKQVYPYKHMFLKEATFARSRIEFCSTKLGSSSYFTAVVFSNRLYCYYSNFRQIFYIVVFAVIGVFIVFTISKYVCVIFLVLGCWL